MKKMVSKLVGLILLISVSGCAFSVPEKNYLTQNNLDEFNALYPHTVISRIAYDPAFPNPVGPDHQLYKSVSLGNVEEVPEVIRNINIAIASSVQFEIALRNTLRDSNLLSEDNENTKYFLDVNYIKNDFFALTTTIHYLFRKKGDALPLLDRDFASTVVIKNNWGGMMWQHARIATRLAHMLNIASITWCLEQYDGAKFPDNCNLTYVSLD